MTKTELIDAVASKLAIKKKDVAPVVDEVFAQIQGALAGGDRCSFVGFGTFKVVERAAREGHNPQNPSETIHIPARKVPVFRAGKEFRDSIKS